MPPKNKNKGKKGDKPLDAMKDNFADKLGINTDDNDTTQADTSLASQETPTNQSQIDFKDDNDKEGLQKQEEEKKSSSKDVVGDAKNNGK